MKARKKPSPRRTRNRIAAEHRLLPGAPPGVLRIDPEAPHPQIQALSYGGGAVVDRDISEVSELDDLLREHRVTWIQVTGLGSESILGALRDLLNLHPLALEDVLNEHQRPKVEEYPHHLFAALQALDAQGGLPTEQLNVFWGDRWVLTLQKKPAPRFEAVRTRIREGRSRILEHGPDFLAYCLLDAVVDDFVPLVDQHLDELSKLEEAILEGSGQEVLSRLSGHKHELVALRRAISPLREAVSDLLRSKSLLVDEHTHAYLRDTMDHARQLDDLIHAALELAAGLLSVHLSMENVRTGETMRLLTIIATIFIPLTFLAGVWGMNFKDEQAPYNMPELRWAFGYPTALAIMLVTALTMLLYFRRRGWLGGRRG